MKFCKNLLTCLREDAFLVDFEKCWQKMRIWTRKSALIQPRTSPGKSDGVVAHGCRFQYGIQWVPQRLFDETLAGVAARCDDGSVLRVPDERRELRTEHPSRMPRSLYLLALQNSSIVRTEIAYIP